MKLCPTCQEEFAEKFSFCPVDGTPLPAQAAAPAATVEYFAMADEPLTIPSQPPTNGSSNGQQTPPPGEQIPPFDEQTVPHSAAATPPAEREEYHLTMLLDEGLTSRLMRELGEVAHQSQLTWPEFKRDPAGFSKRMASGYGAYTRNFFNQPYVTLATLTGFIGMMLAVTLLVFPYQAAYKWFFSDGTLVANVGMPIEEVRQKSTLKLRDGNNADAPLTPNDNPNTTLLSSGNLGFDFELEGADLKFEWARTYALMVDENQQVTGLGVEISQRNETWSQLKASLLELTDYFEVKGFDPVYDEYRNSSVKMLNARFDQPAPASGVVGEYKFINHKNNTILTLLAKRVGEAKEGEDPSAGAAFVHFVTVEKLSDDLDITMLNPIPKEQPTPDEGTAGMAKGKGGGQKPKQEKPGGGGGGGREEQKPASFGKLPEASLAPQILPPNPHPPAIKNPSLPTVPTIRADPTLFPPDMRPIPLGDPKSTSTETSAGPGKGGGIGTGEGSGVGEGEGQGFGPGRGFNTGGGDGRVGGGGPGGGGGGGGEPDYKRPFRASEVTRKAVLLSKPEPAFTEEARKNNVTGLVRLKLLLGANGGVSNISVMKGLSAGLTESAIAAAHRIRFTPAQKDGRNVAQWITIEYNFNIY